MIDTEQAAKAFERLLTILARLRRECPWDREQTMESLRNCTIEETFELADAIADTDYQSIKRELGDLLLHVVFYARIGEEEGRFDIAEVIDTLCEKLIFRHPHVFGETHVNGSQQVMQNWEDLKLKEKQSRRGVLDGVPRSLPAMVKAFRISEKAASAGFDWEQPADVWAKVREEIDEVGAEMTASEAELTAAYDVSDECSPAEKNRDRLESEFGDLFFALVNAARLYGVDPEMALERSNKKFIRRFEHIERQAEKLGTPLREVPLARMEEWWQEAKNN